MYRLKLAESSDHTSKIFQGILLFSCIRLVFNYYRQWLLKFQTFYWWKGHFHFSNTNSHSNSTQIYEINKSIQTRVLRNSSVMYQGNYFGECNKMSGYMHLFCFLIIRLLSTKYLFIYSIPCFKTCGKLNAENWDLCTCSLFYSYECSRWITVWIDWKTSGLPFFCTLTQ